MTDFTITAQPRAIRYLILVDGDIAQANGRRVDALKRAAVIERTWSRWTRIEVIDSWNVHTVTILERAASQIEV